MNQYSANFGDISLSVMINSLNLWFLTFVKSFAAVPPMGDAYQLGYRIISDLYVTGTQKRAKIHVDKSTRQNQFAKKENFNVYRLQESFHHPQGQESRQSVSLKPLSRPR